MLPRTLASATRAKLAPPLLRFGHLLPRQLPFASFFSGAFRAPSLPQEFPSSRFLLPVSVWHVSPSAPFASQLTRNGGTWPIQHPAVSVLRIVLLFRRDFGLTGSSTS